MKRLFGGVLLSIALTVAAQAALKIGDRAPDFSAIATLGGNEFSYSLAEALHKGPVVLYFFPAAFTQGCTIEAHEFAEAIPQFASLGASVIGVSKDSIATLKKFSVSECRSKFAVAADTDGKIMKAYDATLSSLLGYADRTSYVIAPDAHVIYEYSDLDPTKHVDNTLRALREWEAKQK